MSELSIETIPEHGKPNNIFKRIRLSIRNHKYSFWSFFIPFLILWVSYSMLTIFPFGNRNVLIVDMYHQYAPFLSELQNKLQHLSSLLYSWNGGLGGDFYATMAYYLASPLNVLLVLFPAQFLTEGILLISLIKVGLTGLFCYTFLKGSFGPTGWHTTAISAMYALSGFTLAYSWNIMWMDGVFILPLVVLGLVQLVRDGKGLLFVFSLAYALYANFYISFFICMFVLFYYPVIVAQHRQVKGFKHIVKLTSKVGGLSLLALCLAAVMVIPTFIAIRNTSASGDSWPKSLTEFYQLMDYVSAHFMITTPTIREGLPNLYCGFAVLILLPFYFINSRIPRWTKILSVPVLAFLIFSFNINYLNFIWHGLHYPNQLPHRFSFVYIFLILVMVYQVLEHIELHTKTQMALSAGFVAGLVLLVQKTAKTPIVFPNIYVNLAMAGLWGAVLTSGGKGKRLKNVIMAFFIMTCVELSINTPVNMAKVDLNEHFSTREGYTSGVEVKTLRQEIAAVKAREDGFFRMEVFPPKTPNDPALYRYPGLSVFSSMSVEKMAKLMEDFGYHSNSINSYKNEGSTLVMDSLFGIKYTLRRGDAISSFSQSILSESGNIKTYLNPYALSLGYLAPESMIKFTPSGSTPFYVQNKLVRELTGVDNLFEERLFDLGTTVNATITMSKSRFEMKRPNKAQESKATFTMTSEIDQYLYLYWQTKPSNATDCTIEVNDTKYRFGAHRSTVADIGYCKAGDTIRVHMTFPANSDDSGNYTFVGGGFTKEAFEKMIKPLQDNQWQITKFTDTRVEGLITADKQSLLMTSIPYNLGWRVKDNGVRVKPVSIANGFLAVQLSPGEHKITMAFVPYGFGIGLLVTLLAMLFLLTGWLLKWRWVRRDQSVYDRIEDTHANDMEIQIEQGENIKNDEVAE